MRFHLVDRILECEPGRSLVGVKHLTLGEEYLRDHFPTFPVMPGVLMLHALVEASAWLWRVTEDFRFNVIVLREAKNVKYGTFMQPGKILELRTELIKAESGLATFKGKGFCEGVQTVSGQVVLAGYQLNGRRTDGSELDAELASFYRRRYEWLNQPSVEAV